MSLHNYFHVGSTVLYKHLAPVVTHPSLGNIIHQIVHDCQLCAKISPQGHLLHPSFPTHQFRGHIPGQVWQADFPTCLITKPSRIFLPLSVPFQDRLKSLQWPGRQLIQLLGPYCIHIFGLPQSVQSDTDLAFVSQITNKSTHCVAFTHSMSYTVIRKSKKRKWAP